MGSGAPRPPFARARVVGGAELAVPLALALRERAAAQAVDLVEPEPAALAAARALGLSTAPRASLLSGSPDAVLLAGPAEALGEQIAEWARLAPGALLVGVCGVQRAALAAAARVQERHPELAFVAAHPILDGEAGAGRPRAELLLGRPVALCPLPGAPGAALASVEALWRLLGAIPVTLPAEEHDRRAALSSHLPYLAAAALAGLAARAVAPGAPEDLLLGPAFLDATRPAAGPSAPWTGLLERNADHAARAARALAAELAGIAELLEGAPPAAPGGRAAALAARFAPGAAFRRRLEER